MIEHIILSISCACLQCDVTISYSCTDKHKPSDNIYKIHPAMRP